MRPRYRQYAINFLLHSVPYEHGFDGGTLLFTLHALRCPQNSLPRLVFLCYDAARPAQQCLQIAQVGESIQGGQTFTG